jgi:hypothetical protein
VLQRGWQKVCNENFNIGFRKQSWERTSYIGLRKAKLKKSQREQGTVHSASLGTKSLRVMHRQFLGMDAGLQEHQGFERAKERWDSASLGAKDLSN